MTKDMMVKALSNFIASKGVETMGLTEYKSHGSDVPVKDYMLRRSWGSWARVLSAMNKRYPIQVTVPVVAEVTVPKTKTVKGGK